MANYFPGLLLMDSQYQLISIVVPFLNEQDTLETLSKKVDKAFTILDISYEIIFVDDGSTDNGAKIIEKLSKKNDRVRLIRFTRNFGKAAAISAGFLEAKGQVIITMDADLQDDPAEIPNFLNKISEGYDYVSGWKKSRQDPLGKKIPSKVFNWMTSKLFDIKIHDINCGFKAYSKRAAGHLNLYGEMHRFTPAILHSAGYRGTEISVHHNPREHGVSKYGTERIIKGLLDMFTVKMMTTYNARPLHFFAMFGLPLCILGASFIIYLTVLWFLGMGPIGDRPLLLIGILLFVTGTQVLSVGFVAELLQSTRINEQQKYVIDRIVEKGQYR
ncbi:glycosyltransferase family 2 protein [uncultured Kiloniella sp.]|uniref:glycosyltransferase family 2 protein n=2 Tax=Kiloniella TaxID=454159 RepID=UPI0026180B7B|nr:glycosyltransferase family 2 protein [uncultured Kiloniella sp.]